MTGLTVQDQHQPWGEDAADRWVMIRAAILSSPLWHADGSCDTWEGLPPIPIVLAAQIDAFAEWHDELDATNTSFPRPFYWEQRADAPLHAFNEEGRAIARALKAALPCDWTVVYQDIDAWLRPKGAPLHMSQLILTGEK